MKNFAKSAAAAMVAVATLAAAVPAGAQVWRDGPRGDYRYDRGDYRDNWRDARNDNWRGDNDRRWRQHCWTEKRWDPYRHKRVKVRLCNRY